MGTGTGSGMRRERGPERGWRALPGQIQDGNGDRSGDGNESNSGDGNGDKDGNGNEDRIGEGGEKAKKRKKPHKTCRRHVGNGGDFGGKRKIVEKKGLVQKLSTEIIKRLTRKQGREHKVPRV